MVPSSISSCASAVVSDLIRRPVLVEHALHVGQEQQPLCLQRRGERRGEGVGVDVERLALRPHPDRGDHRDQVGMDDHVDDVRIDGDGVADKAEIDDLLDIGIGIAEAALDAHGPHQVGVLAGDADRLAALRVDGGDDLLVDRAGRAPSPPLRPSPGR